MPVELIVRLLPNNRSLSTLPDDRVLSKLVAILSGPSQKSLLARIRQSFALLLIRLN